MRLLKVLGFTFMFVLVSPHTKSQENSLHVELEKYAGGVVERSGWPIKYERIENTNKPLGTEYHFAFVTDIRVTRSTAPNKKIIAYSSLSYIQRSALWIQAFCTPEFVLLMKRNGIPYARADLEDKHGERPVSANCSQSSYRIDVESNSNKGKGQPTEPEMAK